MNVHTLNLFNRYREARLAKLHAEIERGQARLEEFERSTARLMEILEGLDLHGANERLKVQIARLEGSSSTEPVKDGDA